MEEYGRRIYYDIANGNVIYMKNQMAGVGIVPLTIEEDLERFTPLKDWNATLVGVVELDYGSLDDKFNTCIGLRVDPETEELIFTFPEEGQDPTPPPLPRNINEILADQAEQIRTLQEAFNVLLGL